MNEIIVTSISSISPNEWNALAGENPTSSHAYLLALEESSCACPTTGWTPKFLALYRDNKLVGAMPLYLKTHSYGEFVFDWAWAEAYENCGLAYYPKLVASIPFTPVSGARILGASPKIRFQLLQSALELAKKMGVSSFHCLFPKEEEAREIAAHGLMLRNTIQFHWKNQGYKTFEDFLAGMRHDKRKKIRQERKKLRDAGITFERIEGINLTPEHWAFFYQCYLQTHKLYSSPPSLSLDFFLTIGRTIPAQILLIFAVQQGKRIAAAFDLFDSQNFYGRSWGALEYVPGLHFEVCYYQAIEFCIERGLQTFEGGAQGEHKLSRGLLPVTTWSAHWLAHPEFARAVDDFLLRETGAIVQYVDELNESNPFKKK